MATIVRHQIIAVTTLAAVIMYLDRVCIAEIAKRPEFRESLGLSKEQVGTIMSAFFLSYALSQLPAGWISDRFGARLTLPLYICVWSLCTLATGWATGFAMVLVFRYLFGISQAGCYPTASSLIRRWIPLPRRGTASSIVSFGGRMGAAISPLLTAWLLSSVLSWQMVLTLYGVIGFAIAFLFWCIYRESPAEHPRCDAKERELILSGTDSLEVADPLQGAAGANVQRKTADFPPILQIVFSGSMWLMSLLQYGINIGWVFLVSWMPTYLTEVRLIEETTSGLISTIVLSTGVVGMLCGGPLTDFTVSRLGKRWGRTLPMLVCFSIATIAFLIAGRVESTVVFVILAALIAFVTDLSVPSIWAFMQDVGGKNTAAYFGWGNMWGNLGAATTPWLLPKIVDMWDENGDWLEVFWLLAGGYALATICALLIRVKPHQ